MAIANEKEKIIPEQRIKPENFKAPESENENLENREQVELGADKTLEKTQKLEEDVRVDKTSLKEAEVAPIKTRVLSYRERRAQEIDNILASGLHEIFLSLDKKKQVEFKQKGDETVIKINNILDKTKVRVDKIIDLIKKWLKIIPGINQFFLEQEAKIKADKIVNLKDRA